MKALRLPRRRASRLKLFSALGVLAAAILAVNANVLVARRYMRWDFTSDGLYTLSEPTVRTLRSLTDPVQVLVLMSRTDPLGVGVRHLLTAYGAETQELELRFLDPEQDPAEFSVIQQKYGILSGRTEEGRLVTDASLIIARGERHWFITPDEMMRFDAESGRARPRLEQALTEGIVNVLSSEKPLVCFSRGHQEASLSDAGPDGLAELRDRIEKSNYAVAERDLPGIGADALRECRLLVIAAPRLPFAASDAARVAAAVREGMSAFLLIGPIAREDGTLASSGLEPVLELASAALGRNLIVETDPDARLPRGTGEIYFARPTAHPVTEGLLQGSGSLQLRVLINQSQSVRPLSDRAKSLLISSDQAAALTDIRPLLQGKADEAIRGSSSHRHVLAVASELEKPPQKDHPPRLLVAGSGNIAGGRSFRDAALYGNRLFVENAISWLAARPALVSVPEKRAAEIGLALTEESLGEVLRYVVIYMPLSAAALGIFVILRRRATEKRSRRSQAVQSEG